LWENFPPINLQQKNSGHNAATPVKNTGQYEKRYNHAIQKSTNRGVQAFWIGTLHPQESGVTPGFQEVNL
jgi:hypothetical protein